jgi:hypothetical protein
MCEQYVGTILDFLAHNWQGIAEVGTSIGTLVLAYYAAKQIHESKLEREMRYSPLLALYGVYDPQSQTSLLQIRNLGGGSAMQISYVASDEKGAVLVKEGIPLLVPRASAVTSVDLGAHPNVAVKLRYVRHIDGKEIEQTVEYPPHAKTEVE